MTPQQSKALTYIRSYIAANGYAPSVREISRLMGHASPSSGVYILCKLRFRTSGAVIG